MLHLESIPRCPTHITPILKPLSSMLYMFPNSISSSLKILQTVSNQTLCNETPMDTLQSLSMIHASLARSKLRLHSPCARNQFTELWQFRCYCLLFTQAIVYI